MAGKLEIDGLKELIALWKQFQTEAANSITSLKNVIVATEAFSDKDIKAAKTLKELSDAMEKQKQYEIETEKKRKQLEKTTAELEIIQQKLIKATNEAVISSNKLEKQTQDTTKATNNSIKELREGTKALIEMKVRGEENTEAYKQLAKQLGKLKDDIGDARAEVKYFASDTRVIDSVIEGFKAAGAAVQIVEGSMQALGVENKSAEEAIKKLVAIQSVMNGLQEIQNALQKESALRMGLNALATKASSAAQSLYTAVVGKSTGALKAFKIALATTGIGLIVVAIGALVANWDKLTGSIKDNTEALTANTEANNKILDIEKERQANKDKGFERQFKNDELQIENQKLLGATELEVAKMEEALANKKLKKAQELAELNKNEIQNIEQYRSSVDSALSVLQSLYSKVQDKAVEGQVKYWQAELENRKKRLENAENIADREIILAQEATEKTINVRKLEAEVRKQINEKVNAEILLQNQDFAKFTQANIDEMLAKKNEQNITEVETAQEKYDRLRAIADKARDIDYQRIDEEYATKLEKWTGDLDERQAIEDEYNNANLTANEMYQKQLSDIAYETGLGMDEADAMFTQNKLDRAKRANDILAGMSKQLVDLEKTNSSLKIALVNQAFETARELAGKQSVIGKILLAAQKALAVAEVWIKTFAANAIIAAEAAAAAIPTAGASIVIGSSLIAANKTNAILQTALIAAASIPEFAFAKGTKDSPGGLAWVGEKGTEIIKTPDGGMYLTPDHATKAFLPEHSEVIPNHLVKNELAEMGVKSSQVKENKVWTEILEAIKTKKETSINMDANGFSVHLANRGNVTKFINDRYRC